MKKKIKQLLEKAPGVKQFLSKLDRLDNRIKEIEYENRLLAQENIDLRLRMKKANGEKINVVFVCHRPPVWESLHSVYDALKEDPHFCVTIVAIPNKKELPGSWFWHEEYESEGAEEFWKECGCINGYDYETKQWYDLRELKPDYVFFQQPYNVFRCLEYQSQSVSKYAKIAYVSYYALTGFDINYECNPADYLRDLSFYFTQNSDDQKYILNRFKMIGCSVCKAVNTGFPRYDRIRNDSGSSEIWKDKDSFKIIWTPRWTTNEGTCHFFEYKDKFVEFCKESEDVEFVFRPHPQAFREWESRGELSTAEREKYLEHYRNGRMHLDQSGDYLPLLFSSDCLITDISAIMVDYFCTYKPIIYCSTKNYNLLETYSEGVYAVNDWNELIQTVNQLRKGYDPLKGTRKRIVDEYIRAGKGNAGERIKDILLKDAMK